jgi:hypothetical protein
MDDPYDPDGNIVERLRELVWAVPISRDHMLKVISSMPDFVRERGLLMAERLTMLCTWLQGFLKKLPDDAVVLTAVTPDLDRLRSTIEDSLRDLDLLLADLRLFMESDDEASRKLYN